MILTIAAQAQKVGMGLTILSTRIIIKFLSKLIKAENMKRESANIFDGYLNQKSKTGFKRTGCIINGCLLLKIRLTSAWMMIT